MLSTQKETNYQKIILSAQLLYLSKRRRVFQLRRMQRADSELLLELFMQLSPDTLQKRFMRPYFHFNEESAREHVSRLWIDKAEKQYIVLATVRGETREQVIGVAELLHSGNPADPADIGLLVRDDYQREGVGTKLVQELGQVARARGITHWRADTTASNVGVWQLVQKSGCLYQAITSHGETEMFGTF
jgi:GNAT superfamily N-acetyltransferase